MAAPRSLRSRTVQPELPLPAGEPAPLLDPAGERVVGDWRIDEHTRSVGRRGIAAARARLAATAARADERARALAERSEGRAA